MTFYGRKSSPGLGAYWIKGTRIPTTGAGYLCRAKKKVVNRNDESILPWLRHIERMEKSRIFEGKYIGSRHMC